MLEMKLPLEVVRLLPKIESVVRLEENGLDKMNLLQFLPVLADKLRVGLGSGMGPCCITGLGLLGTSSTSDSADAGQPGC